MILYPWAGLFLVALLPGGLIGILLAKLPIDSNSRSLLSAYLASLAGYVISLNNVSTSFIVDATHAHNIAFFAPPIFLAILLGIREADLRVIKRD